MALEKLPSIIRDTTFDEKGFVKTNEGLMVPAYVGSQRGFSVEGKEYLDNIFYPELKKRGVLSLCPFSACSEYLDFSKINKDMPLSEYINFWNDFNNLVGPVNYETLMLHSKFMIALFDGSHACDDGLCSEVAYHAIKHGPIVGIRSDFRLAENIAAPINPAVRYFIDQGPYKGKLFLGDTAYREALSFIEKFVEEIKLAHQR